MAWDDVYTTDGMAAGNPAGPRISLPPIYAPSVDIVPGQDDATPSRPPVLNTSWADLREGRQWAPPGLQWTPEARRVGQAASEAWTNAPPILTPYGEERMTADLGPIGTYIVNPAAKIGSGLIGAGAAGVAGLGAIAQGVMERAGTPPALQRDINLGAPAVLADVGPGLVRRTAAMSNGVPGAPPDPPNLAQTRALADQRYKLVDQNAAAAVTPEYATQGIDDAIKTLAPTGDMTAALSRNDPKLRLAIDLSQSRGKPITLGDFRTADQQIGQRISSEVQPDGGLSPAGGAMRGVQLDLRDHFANAGPDDVVGGQAGFDLLDPARKTHAQAEKMQDVQDILYKAGLAENEGPAIRSGIKGWLTSNNSRGLTDMERAAFERATQRSMLGTPLYWAGNKIIGPAFGGLLGGPAGMVAGEGAGVGARMVTDSLARARVQSALRVLGQGVPGPWEGQ